MVKWSYQTSVNPLGFLQNWRLTEAEIDGFCHFWYDGILRLHILADDVDKQTDDASIALN